MRWKSGIRDLNPLLQYCVKSQGVSGGLVALLLLNLVWLTVLIWHPTLLAIYFGGKLSLAALQLRSLIENGKLSCKPELR